MLLFFVCLFVFYLGCALPLEKKRVYSLSLYFEFSKELILNLDMMYSKLEAPKCILLFDCLHLFALCFIFSVCAQILYICSSY